MPSSHWCVGLYVAIDRDRVAGSSDHLFHNRTHYCSISERYSPYSLIFRQRVEREIPRLLAAFVVLPAV